MPLSFTWKDNYIHVPVTGTAIGCHVNISSALHGASVTKRSTYLSPNYPPCPQMARLLDVGDRERRSMPKSTKRRLFPHPYRFTASFVPCHLLTCNSSHPVLLGVLTAIQLPTEIVSGELLSGREKRTNTTKSEMS